MAVLASTAASGAQARRADALQVDHHQGPGFHAVKGRQPVISPELRFDSRWRFWAPQAADLGLRSVLSLALTDGDPFGAVTLYSTAPVLLRYGVAGPRARVRRAGLHRDHRGGGPGTAAQGR